MIFKPRDENSLRHLFSSSYAEAVLDLSYVGPVLGDADAIETSPDAIILDKRRSPFRTLRCEFKYCPSDPQEFAHNGRFDIAVVWSLPTGQSKAAFLSELGKQNGCGELVVLTDMKAFRDLPVYTLKSQNTVVGTVGLRDIAIRKELPQVFALCIAAQLYPKKFSIDKMKERLRRFPSVKKMKDQGLGNLVGAFLQSKPPLLELRHGRLYRWTSEIDSVGAAKELEELIRENFGEEPPSDSDAEAVQE